MGETIDITQWITPIALITSGIILGTIFERVVLGKLKKIASKTTWEGDEMILAALRGMTFLWFIIAGLYGAALTSPLKPAYATIIEKVLLIAVILSLTIVLARISVGLVKLYSQKVEGILPSTSIFINLTRLLVFLLGSLIMLHSLGVSIMPLLTALGVGGLAVALALQDTLSNLFAGVHIIASRQILPGNYVKLDSGEEGYVTDITWRSTTIRTFPNNLVIVPNSKLSAAIITNYDLPETNIKFYVPVGVSYDSNLEKVERVTVDVAKEIMSTVPGGVPDSEPVIRFHTFADFSINLTVVLHSREFADQYLIKHEFIKKLHERYRNEGIEIPFPVRTVYTRENKE
jgi:small-conductance mechanosensitive channel